MTAFFGPRAGAESAFIVAVAVLAYLLELSFAGVVAAIFGAWFVVAVFEVVASRNEAIEKARRPDEEAVAGEPDAVVGDAEPLSPLLPSPEQAPPPPPAPHAVRIEPVVEEDGDTGASGGDAETVAVPVAPPPPPPTAALLPAPVAPPAPPPPPAAAPPSARVEPRRPREWNLWELERAARELAGRDPVRDEERSFLLMYLREFADAEGNLPEEFDGLVRDSFADLLAAGR